MRIALPALLVVLLALSAISQPESALQQVVSPAWLQQHQNDPDLVVLHMAFSRREYQREHISGARFIWFSWLSPSTPDGSTEMATVQDAERVLGELGISSTSKLVVYFAGNGLSTTTRTIYSLKYFGFEGRVALLDGGLDAWKRAGGAVTQEVPQIRPTNITIKTRPDLIADAEYVRQHIGDPAVSIIDARAKNFYDGTASGMRPGHIKSALSLPFSNLADSLTQLKPRDELEKLFREAGVKKGSTIVAYCHVGQQATVVLQAARLLGYPVKLYDGSFEEWPSLDEARYPVELPTPVQKP